ncbi:MAG: hypothetical protein IH612_02515 [Desulfofustis sp.]|nr:hypothetical protein [Desulfofustis sp.]
MKPPVFKKEIHFRLLRRIAATCLLAMLLTAAGLLFLEYHRLADAVLRDAERESGLFAGIIALSERNQEGLPADLTEQLLLEAMEQSSYIQVSVTATDQRPLFSAEREDGATRAAAFAAAAPALPASGAAAGRLHFSDNRLYQQVVIPLRDIRSRRVIGFLDGVYRLSLDDTTAALRWFGLAAALACAALVVCGLLLYPAMILLQHRLIISSGEANRANGFLLRKLARAMTATDPSASTHHHLRLVVYTAALATQQGVARTTMRGLIQAAFLFGIDRQGPSAEVVGKRDQLEQRELKQLAAAHKRLLKEIKRYRWLREAEPIIRCWHERYDGSGYPAGLSGEAIPIGARILAIAVDFDTLTVPGQGRDPVDLTTALHTIEQESGRRFDPVLVSAFVAIAPTVFAELTTLDETGLDRRVDGVIKGYLPC